ncbi:hypothetical protein ACTD5D_39655 [Nocardia takedensis]|uniref:hypothetical protein n=1 Tax=Nocardia takedensis TaxID=259390 RepID=UPI003F763434
MSRWILIAAATAFVCAGCGGNDTPDDSAAPSTTVTAALSASPNPVESTSSAPAPTAAPPVSSDARKQACNDMLPFLDELRKTGGAAAAEKAAEDAVQWLPTRPEWETTSPAERADTIAGIRDAATGSCD